MSTLTPLSEVDEMLLDLWKCGPRTLFCYTVELRLSSQKNVKIRWFRCKYIAFDTFSSFFNQIDHYWMP